MGSPKGEALELVQLIAKMHGLGKYILLLTKAAQRAKKNGQRVTWQHFIDTHDLVARMAFVEEEK